MDADEIKNLIDDQRSYIASEFCEKPHESYREIDRLRKLLADLPMTNNIGNNKSASGDIQKNNNDLDVKNN